jgi:hypothetical protein
MKSHSLLRKNKMVSSLCGAALLGMVGFSAVGHCATAEETPLFQSGFEASKGILFWPNGAVVTLDSKNFKSGASSISFTPDNNYVAYWYLDVKPAHRYKVTLWYRADKKMLARNGVAINFNLPGQGNGSGGRTNLSFGENKADSEWHEFEATFDVPEKVTKVQFLVDLFRTIAAVNIDDLKVTEVGPTPESAKAAPAAPTNTDTFSNGDFSQGLTKWSPWFKDEEAKAVVDNENKHEGKSSVRMTGGAGRHMLAQRVSVTPGALYTISFWARTENDTTGNSAVAFDFQPTNAAPRPYRGLESLKGSVDWKQFSFEAEAPADAKFAYLCLIHGGGTINFTDVRVVENK